MSPATSAGKITLHHFVWCPILLVLIICPVSGYETGTDLSTPQNLTTAAGQLYNAGEYHAALDKLDAALLISPDMVDAWYLKGQINLRLEKYPSAIVAFDRAIQLNPKKPEYWCGRGDAFFAQKQYRNALPSYESAIARNPGDTAALMGKARSQLALGLYAPAVESFDQVLRNDVNSIEALLGRGIALKSLGKFRDADSAFDTVIRLDPGNVQAWEYKGAALFESGDRAGAIEAYDQVLLLDPKRDDIRRIRNELLTAQALQVTPVPENTSPFSDDSRNIQNPGLNLPGIDGGLLVAFIIISGIVIGIVAVKRVRIRREPEPVFTIDTRLLKKEIDEFRSALPEMQLLPDPLPTPEVPDAPVRQHQPCEQCGALAGIPAVCSYCKRGFCPDHLSPPDHHCSYIRDWERARSVPVSGDGPEKDSASTEK